MVMIGFRPSFLRFLAARLLLVLACPLVPAEEGGGFWDSGDSVPFMMVLLMLPAVV